MEKTGMTRRIDELGRLVIPKEIRKNLKIKDNDQVEILVNDNKIILSKYENLSKDKNISLLINILKKSINKNILFTSRNKIIDYALIGKEKIDNDVLSSDIMNIIENRKNLVNYDYNDYLYSIDPLIINGDLYGSLIVYDKDSIRENELRVVEFCKMFLENYLE